MQIEHSLVDFALVVIARIPRVLLLSSGAEEPVSERTLIEHHHITSHHSDIASLRV